MFQFFVIVLGIFLGAPVLGSCCASGSTSGIGRLLAHERALIEVSQDFHKSYGYFGDRGNFKKGMPLGANHWQFNHELFAMARVFPFLMPYVKVPIRTQLSVDHVESRLADISVGARWPLFSEEIIPHVPGLHLFSSVQFPSGHARDEKTLDDAEVTGLGTYLISFGAALEKTYFKLLWTLAYHLSFEPRLFLKKEFAGGPLHVPSISLAYVVHEEASLSATLSASLSANARYDGESISDTARQKFTAVLGYAWKFHSHLSLVSSLGGDIPLFGKNNHSEIFFRLGMRVGVF